MSPAARRTALLTPARQGQRSLLALHMTHFLPDHYLPGAAALAEVMAVAVQLPLAARGPTEPSPPSRSMPVTLPSRRNGHWPQPMRPTLSEPRSRPRCRYMAAPMSNSPKLIQRSKLFMAAPPCLPAAIQPRLGYQSGERPANHHAALVHQPPRPRVVTAGPARPVAGSHPRRAGHGPRRLRGGRASAAPGCARLHRRAPPRSSLAIKQRGRPPEPGTCGGPAQRRPARARILQIWKGGNP